MDKALKKRHKWKIIGFVAFNILLFASISLGVNIDLFFNDLLRTSILNKISPSLISLLVTIVLIGLIPSEVKASIVFHRIKNPLPGTRVFNQLAINDSRINLESIKNEYGELPVDPRAQNQLWYTIYKDVRDLTTIQSSHDDYLLTRDLTAISFLFLIILSTTLLFIEASTTLKLVYFGFLFIQFILLKIVAHNYGNRFVCNVLAEVS